MTLADEIAIAALILTIVGLFIVLYQTHISRESLFAAKDSLDAARQSIEMTMKASQLESLPKSDLIIIVMHHLTSWQSDLEAISQDLKTAKHNQDDALMKAIATQRGWPLLLFSRLRGKRLTPDAGTIRIILDSHRRIAHGVHHAQDCWCRCNSAPE